MADTTHEEDLHKFLRAPRTQLVTYLSNEKRLEIKLKRKNGTRLTSDAGLPLVLQFLYS
jgi:hypothetical protein